MNWRYLSCAILFFGGALSVSFNKACADTDLSIVTSYPSAFYEPVRQAFEGLHPDIHLKISNRKTTSAVAAIIDGTRTPADIFWASSTDAFEVLKQAGRLARLPARYPRSLSLGANPIDDPDGFYAGFAISGYGIVWNTQDLAERGISPPTSIKSLAEFRYRGLIGMTSPSRSGTTHLMVETLLQAEGWEAGWATWSEIGGNLATFMARSYSVGAAVAEGRVPIGLSIDFLGGSRKAGSSVGFVYPSENVFLPASVAILEGTKAYSAAVMFIDFLNSSEGQLILQTSPVPRLPIDPAAYGESAENPYRASALKPAHSFDATLSSERYELVNLLFDEVITYRLAALQAAWGRVHDIEVNADSVTKARLAVVRRLLCAVPVNESDTRDPTFRADLKRTPWGVTPSLKQAALLSTWRAFLQDNLSRATEILDTLAKTDSE